MKYSILSAIVITAAMPVFASVETVLSADTVSAEEENVYDLGDFVIKQRKIGKMGLNGPETGFQLNQTELCRAACCNLGESFTTNASVDVNYADPATGARQIKLLGLSGSYVQMLTENLPAFRGAAMPYAFRYIAGPWMKSIRVSKGCSTVKNGYESITGQINVEYLKPDDDPSINVNGYIDNELRMEVNADANFHVAPGLSTIVLAHFEDRYYNHDSNHDGFVDMPDIRQVNVMNRWKYVSDKYIFHGGLSYINEKSRAGQIGKHITAENPYLITLGTDRYDGYMKHALILNHEHNTNIALAGNLSMHQLRSGFGKKSYCVNEKGAYAQLMFETEFTEAHSLSTGLSLNYDYLGQHLDVPAVTMGNSYIRDRETVSGVYAQYTFKLHDKLTAMAGVRGDYSTINGFFVTPRFNVKYNPIEILSLRASAGKGFRSVHPWAEFNYLLASGRTMVVENIHQEEAWNYGINAELKIPIGPRYLTISADYFRTDFRNQAVVDYDSYPGVLAIANLDGKSYSNVYQAEATYDFDFGLGLTMAYRYNDVKMSYNGNLIEKALTSRYKALFTASYKTPLELWQFDATFVMNGGGRMPAPYKLPDGSMSWDNTFPAFPSLNIQVTRWFRHFSIYLGGENLTNFKQKNPIINAADPWTPAFEPTVVWGPTSGAMVYVGIRYNIK